MCLQRVTRYISESALYSFLGTVDFVIMCYSKFKQFTSKQMSPLDHERDLSDQHLPMQLRLNLRHLSQTSHNYQTLCRTINNTSLFKIDR